MYDEAFTQSFIMLNIKKDEKINMSISYDNKQEKEQSKIVEKEIRSLAEKFIRKINIQGELEKSGWRQLENGSLQRISDGKMLHRKQITNN
jgi:hypothetical protein